MHPFRRDNCKVKIRIDSALVSSSSAQPIIRSDKSRRKESDSFCNETLELQIYVPYLTLKVDRSTAMQG